MGNKFYVKIQSKSNTAKQNLILLGMICFIVAVGLQIINVNYFSLVLIIPFLYLLHLYRHLRGSKYQMKDAVCEMFFFDDNFTICLEPKCGIIEGTCRIKYDDMDAFNIYDDGKIEIKFHKIYLNNRKEINRKEEIVFYMNSVDKNKLKERLKKVIGRRQYIDKNL